MTTVAISTRSALGRMRVDGKLLWAVLVCLVSSLTASAQSPPVHWLHAGALPPGAIGSQRLVRGGPLSGYFQPVQIRAPQGARIALAMDGVFGPDEPNQALVGMQIGPVYRFRVTQIPNHPGAELFPTVEVVDRLYPPPGLAQRFPIPIELTANELDMAVRGMFVTRVIYLEDPQLAVPIERAADEQPWFEAPHGDDPLVVADGLGRPMAILRIGGRVPSSQGDDAAFTYGSPPLEYYERADAAGVSMAP